MLRANRGNSASREAPKGNHPLEAVSAQCSKGA